MRCVCVSLSLCLPLSLSLPSVYVQSPKAQSKILFRFVWLEQFRFLRFDNGRLFQRRRRMVWPAVMAISGGAASGHQQTVVDVWLDGAGKFVGAGGTQRQCGQRRRHTVLMFVLDGHAHGRWIAVRNVERICGGSSSSGGLMSWIDHTIDGGSSTTIRCGSSARWHAIRCIPIAAVVAIWSGCGGGGGGSHCGLLHRRRNQRHLWQHIWWVAVWHTGQQGSGQHRITVDLVWEDRVALTLVFHATVLEPNLKWNRAREREKYRLVNLFDKKKTYSRRKNRRNCDLRDPFRCVCVRVERKCEKYDFMIFGSTQFWACKIRSWVYNVLWSVISLAHYRTSMFLRSSVVCVCVRF